MLALDFAANLLLSEKKRRRYPNPSSHSNMGIDS